MKSCNTEMHREPQRCMERDSVTIHSSQLAAWLSYFPMQINLKQNKIHYMDYKKDNSVHLCASPL
jgi:hypothetical protein